MYNTLIYRQQGGSEMTFASGASLNLNAGAVLNNAGTIVNTGAQSYSGATCFASSSIKVGTDIAASGVIGTFELFDFGNGVKFFISRSQNAPSAAGSPGSLMLRLSGTGTPSSAVDFLIKKGDNSPASAGWVVFQTAASAG